MNHTIVPWRRSKDYGRVAMTDTDKLDKAVAKAAGWNASDIEWMHGSVEHPASDWNVLAEARAKLEYERDCLFERKHERWVVSWGNWSLSTFTIMSEMPRFSESFWTGDLASEALAVAKCIYAVKHD